MWTRLTTELERPYPAPRRRAVAAARGRISHTRSRTSAGRESEGVVVPMMTVQHNAVGGKGPYFVHALRSRYARVNAGDG